MQSKMGRYQVSDKAWDEAGERGWVRSAGAAIGLGWKPLSPDKHQKNIKMLACALESACACVRVWGLAGAGARVPSA